MRHRIIEISGSYRHLSLRRGLAVIKDKTDELGCVDLDTALAVLISSHGALISSAFITECGHRNIPILFCDSRFQIISMASPIKSHNDQKRCIDLQAAAKPALTRKLWQQIVKMKILNQSLVLRSHFHSHANRLQRLSKEVKMGDGGNHEAIAARIYWRSLFGHHFRRDKMGDNINGMLNYGYAVIRSALLANVLSTGLYPSIGIHHHNYNNAFCLVDDLMEPYRPLIDQMVKCLVLRQNTELTTVAKRALAQVIVCDMGSADNTEICMQNMLNFVQSFLSSLANEHAKLAPVPILSIHEANHVIAKC